MILYKTRTGITRQLAENIREHLASHGIVSGIKPVEDYRDNDTDGIDYLFLGCWTAGLMVIFQGPERLWIDFARRLPDLSKSTVILFTTYKLLTGTMFKNMQKHLRISGENNPLPVLKSRNGQLTDEGREILDRIIML